MNARIALVISTMQVTLCHWDDTKRVHVARFPNDDSGREAVRRALGTRGQTPASLVVDLPDEEFHIERIPHAIFDRYSLMTRTRKRLFGDAPFCHLGSQSRESSGRRDDVVLCSTLTRPEAVEPWINLLSTAGVPLRTLISVPLLVPTLLQSLCKEIPDHLLVVFFAVSGLRQIYLREGKLAFSRVLPTRDPADVRSHVQSSLQFLRRQEPHAWLDFLLMGNEAHSPVEPGERIRLHRITDAEISAHFGGADPGALELALAAVAAGFSDPGYARPLDRTAFRSMRLRSGLRAATTLTLAGSCVLGVHLLLGMRIDLLATERARQHAALLADRLGNAGRAVEARQLRDAVVTAEWLRDETPAPTALPEAVRMVFVRFPEFRVIEVTWVASTQPEWPGSDNAIRPAVQVADPSKTVFEGMLLRGEVVTVAGYRRTLERLSLLIAALADLPAVVKVELVEDPWDLDPAHSLAGTLSPATSSPRFSLRLLRGAAHGSS